jgi:glutamine amidotransferase
MRHASTQASGRARVDRSGEFSVALPAVGWGLKLGGVIALLDYGSGNLRSVHKALLKVGAEVRIAQRPDEVGDARGMVLPGVGAFDDCIHALQRQELFAEVRRWIGSGRPFLGICVGYQALFERSEEFNSSAAGLSIFGGKVGRFSEGGRLKIPQIGWNQLEILRPDCPLYRGIGTGAYVYFVHSFFPQPADPTIVATRTDYGERFASSVWRENVFATQFHPEKSQAVGLRLLANFVEVTVSGQATVPGFKLLDPSAH